MMKSRNKIIDTARDYLGAKTGSDRHRRIVDLYNSQKVLPRNYKVTYTDNWCATFVSAMAVDCGYTDFIPTECGCQKMIDIYQNMGRFQKNGYRPLPGDIIFYDWKQDGWSDHTGIVECVDGDVLTIIEGNYNNEVKRRGIIYNDKTISGFGCPDYDVEVNDQSVLVAKALKLIEEAAIILEEVL